MVISMIANIANHDPVSTYISQVTGNHPTSTGLCIAKHKFWSWTYIGWRYTFLDKERHMHQVVPTNSYYLMHQTRGLKLVFIKIWETYNAPGLAFQERGRLVVRALRKVFLVGFSFGHLHLLLLGCLLHLWLLLFILEQCHSFGNIYCMHMHNISIMNA
jgi:hypothetical protein